MEHVLRYGENREVRLALAPEQLVADWTGPRGEPIDDPIAAVAAALADPIEFPALAQATAPDDQIAIAVGESTPQADAIVAGIIHELMQGYGEPQNVTIVHTAGTKPPTHHLRQEIRDAIRIVEHDPRDRQSLAYVAAAEDGEPICFQRALADADIVVPIGAFRAEDTLAYYGVHGGLFPTFADETTQKRFREYRNNRDHDQRGRRCREAEQAVWALGVLFTVQVIPGPGDGILAVLAGHSAAVAREGECRVAAAWGYETQRRARLVIASVEGGPEEQSWDNFARALHAADRVADEDGESAIVILTELQAPPGLALQQLQAWEDSVDALDANSDYDGFSAALLAALRDRTSVYLLSRLDEEQVEDLGMGFVRDADDIQRLAGQFDSCILLGAAQRTAPVTIVD